MTTLCMYANFVKKRDGIWDSCTNACSQVIRTTKVNVQYYENYQTNSKILHHRNSHYGATVTVPGNCDRLLRSSTGVHVLHVANELHLVCKIFRNVGITMQTDSSD